MTRHTLRAAPWVKLSRGMAIRAAIEARILGKRLLTLNADITVLPAEDAGRSRHRPASPDRERLRLADAARTLEAAAGDLESARDGMTWPAEPRP